MKEENLVLALHASKVMLDGAHTAAAGKLCQSSSCVHSLHRTEQNPTHLRRNIVSSAHKRGGTL